ncbi:MAG: hypothetical protein U0703_19240 [Anaerolineae bacterium]
MTRPASFPDPASIPMDVRQPTEIASGVVLLGWSGLPASIRPGETLALALDWQAQASTRAPFTLRALLRGTDGETVLWSGEPVDDRYPADQWAEGEILADHVRWTIPREQPAGDYTLTLQVDQSVDLGQIAVAGLPRQFEPPPVASLMNVNFGDQIMLYGYTLRREQDTLSLEIVWRSLDNIPTDYKVFVHLVGEDGVPLTQRDSMPQSDNYPTMLWLPGEYVIDIYDLPALDAGRALRIGLYSPVDGARLPVFDAQHETIGDLVQIAV